MITTIHRTRPLIILACLSFLNTSSTRSDQEWSTRLGNFQRTGSIRGHITGPLTKLWEIKLPRGIRSSPAVAGNLLLIGVPQKRIYALNRLTGDQVWSKKLGGGIESSPVVWNDKVLITTQYPDGRLYFIDLTSGDILKEIEIGDSDCTPTIANDTIYVGTNVGSLFAFGLDDGEKIWDRRLESGINSSPVVVDSVLFVTSQDKQLYRMHTATGRQSHKIEIKGNVWQDLSYSNGRLMLATTTGFVNAYDVSGLEPIWEKEFDAGIFSSVSIAGGHAYFAAHDRFLYALELDKQEIRWRTSLPDVAVATPVTTGEFILIGTLDGTLKLIDAQSGLTTWQERLDGSITSSPIIIDEKIYVVTLTGKVYCFVSTRNTSNQNRASTGSETNRDSGRTSP